MSGACRTCVIALKCHPDKSPCWCCLPGDPWRTWRLDRSVVLPGLVSLLHTRPSMLHATRAWWDGPKLPGVLVESVLWGA